MQSSITTKFDRACAILDKYKRNPNKLIPILQEMQAEYTYLPEEIMTFISIALQISPSTVYGVATFYAHFTLEPKGKYVIKVCDGTACHVKKSEGILEALEKELGLSKENKTTPDMMFTLETVACLGALRTCPGRGDKRKGARPDDAGEHDRSVKRNQEGGADLMSVKVNLEERKKLFDECMSQYKARIIICAGTGCIANGSLDVFDTFREEIKSRACPSRWRSKKRRRIT